MALLDQLGCEQNLSNSRQVADIEIVFCSCALLSSVSHIGLGLARTVRTERIVAIIMWQSSDLYGYTTREDSKKLFFFGKLHLTSFEQEMWVLSLQSFY